jgi:tellurite resistance protein TehA-like permease
MFGLSLFASVVIIGLIWGRLMQHKVGAPAAVPTLWIVLGPLGQSITAAGLMATAARGTLPAVDADGAAAMALLFGLTTWGFAVLWLTVAIAVTARTARAHLPFSLTWWSFTFPVGTLVTGTNGLAARTGLAFFAGASLLLYVVLVVAWLTVLPRTLRAIATGTLPGTARATAIAAIAVKDA